MAIRSLPRLAVSTSLSGRDLAAGPPAPTPGTPASSAWAVVSEARRETARGHLTAVTQAEALHAAGASWAEADASTPTVTRWRRQVAGLPRGERVTALLDRDGPGRRAMLDAKPEMAEIVEALALKGGPHCTATHARRVLLARFAIAPSVRTVARWIAFLRRERERALSAATRPNAQLSRRMPAFGAGDRDAFAPNALWELDSTPADLMCADPLTGVLRRHAVVGTLEVWSRRGMVLIVPVSRGVAITALLRRCLVTWGVPLAVKTDRGQDYVGRHVTRVLADLEIEHELCRPYRPEDKPHIERLLGTLTRDLFAHLPGFTGHDVAQAKALRENRSFAARRRGEAPTFELHLTADELQRRCDLWLSGVYETRPHGGLDGTTPRLRAGRGPARSAPSPMSARWTRCWRRRRGTAPGWCPRRASRSAAISTSPPNWGRWSASGSGSARTRPTRRACMCSRPTGGSSASPRPRPERASPSAPWRGRRRRSNRRVAPLGRRTRR